MRRCAAIALSVVLLVLGGAAAASATETDKTPVSDSFTVAVFPDTQTWVLRDGDKRFPDATRYLLDNREGLNLQLALHTGDITNWGWLDRPQYLRASRGLAVLERAGVPVTVTSGNHDTRAVGHDGVPGSRAYGGSAYQDNPECPERFGEQCRSYLLVRQTQEFNRTFSPKRQGIPARNVWEKGKAENSYKELTVNGVNFLVLTLEFAPRPDVIEWANRVVAAYPRHNVLVQSHHYLTRDGEISPSNAGYGAQSPRYVYDNLVSNNPNVKLIFSGHTGTAASRVDARRGNPVVSLMNNDATGNRSATVRLVRINTESGQIDTQIVDVTNGYALPEYDRREQIKLIR